MPNGNYPYNYERCHENRHKVDILEQKMNEISAKIHEQDKVDQSFQEFIDRYKEEKSSRKNQFRWMLGFLITIVFGIAGIIISIWSKIF